MPPFAFPSGGNPGRAGYPHAGSTLRASRNRSHASMLPASPSIDSLDLREFDFIEVGKILDQSGAVAVVIKSLVFPSDTIAAS
jgi:hypothetical protein